MNYIEVHVSYILKAEQAFHEEITPSLRQNVEHITPWTDLPVLECALEVMLECTDDTSAMDAYCADILEHLRPSISSNSKPSLVSLALAAHFFPPASESAAPMIQTIQICTSSVNYVFKV